MTTYCQPTDLHHLRRQGGRKAETLRTAVGSAAAQELHHVGGAQATAATAAALLQQRS